MVKPWGRVTTVLLIWDCTRPAGFSRPGSSTLMSKLRPVGLVAALEVGSAWISGPKGTWLQALSGVEGLKEPAKLRGVRSFHSL